jgi:hypothetical protein
MVTAPGSYSKSAAVSSFDSESDYDSDSLGEWFCTFKTMFVPATITEFDASSAGDVSHVVKVTFEAGSQIRRFESELFAECWSLLSICLPASVEVISGFCFVFIEDRDYYSPVQKVTFEPGSNLRVLEDYAFYRCSALHSLSLPSALEVIGDCCFMECSTLEEVLFESDSKLRWIGRWVFHGCARLRSFRLPSLLEFVGHCCFFDCNPLLTLTFPCPCRIRELRDLPTWWTGVMEIPDSVEILGFVQYSRESHGRTLSFGRESRLTRITAVGYVINVCRSFVRATSRSLKVFRSNLEFDASAASFLL